MNAIYEQDFLDCSYGFRPGRGAQDALDEVGRVICQKPTAYVLELDIASYFDSIVREQLMEMIEKRISDASMLRLLRKWINIREGLLVSETGTGQGQIISPLLANVYLHFVLDRWFETEVKPRLKGQAFAIRYADDGLMCFERREDAEKVLAVLPKRFAKYGLTLHPEKTRLVKFGRSALAQAELDGTKPATFDFLGFTYQCARSRRGKFTSSLWQFYRGVGYVWRKWLTRRSRGKTLSWARFVMLLQRYPLPLPRIARPWTGAANST